MSWSAHLTDDRGHIEGEWNCTHNTNGMIYAVLKDAGFVLADSTTPCKWYDRETKTWHDAPEGHGTISWYDHLKGLSGPDGAAYLSLIIKGLEADPARFEVMNPSNGWGSYSGLLEVLKEMRDSVPEWPCTWYASG